MWNLDFAGEETNHPWQLSYLEQHMRGRREVQVSGKESPFKYQEFSNRWLDSFFLIFCEF